MKSGTPESRNLPLASAPVTDHTTPTLTGAARALRTSLAQLRGTAGLALVSPKLREAIPQLQQLLECLEDVGDRLTILEKTAVQVDDRLNRVEACIREQHGLPIAIDRLTMTLEQPAEMPSIDYDLSKL